MDLSTLRKTAKGYYGLAFSTAADDEFPDDVLNVLTNDAHKWVVEIARPYYGEITANISAGTSTVNLDPTVLELDFHTVRINLNSTWLTLQARTQRDLTEQYGPLNNLAQGDTVWFYVRGGSAAGAGQVLELVPKPDETVASGLKYKAWTYPADLSGDSDTPALQAAQHHRLIPAICWKMALLQQSRGRENAPVATWYEAALREAKALADIIRLQVRELPRGANAGPTILEDAMSRRVR